MAAAGCRAKRSSRCCSTEVLALIALLIGAGAVAVAWGANAIATEIRKLREATARARSLSIAQTFAPAIAAVQADPRALLVWQPLARTARVLFPEEFAALDRAAGATFPFSPGELQAAHAKWTADWLAWERTHDASYKSKAAAVEQELAAAGASPALRSRLDAIEQEKLDLYQRRYSEYVRVAKGLQALSGTAPPA